jgi:hypothetical protein
VPALPDLNLRSLHLDEAGVYIEAVMLWPRADHAYHLRFVEAVRNDAMRNVLSKRGDRRINPERLNLVVDAAIGPRMVEVIRGDGILTPGYGIIQRYIAYKMFMHVLSCIEAQDPEEPPTLEHARRMIGSAGGKYSSYPSLGRSELIDIWNWHSSAVHLLAAKTIIGLDRRVRAGEANGPLLAEFLAYAEAFRIRGEHHRPPRSKTPLLDPAATWKAPDWVVLPPIPEGRPALPAPARLRAEMANRPHPRDIQKSVAMSA